MGNKETASMRCSNHTPKHRSKGYRARSSKLVHVPTAVPFTITKDWKSPNICLLVRGKTWNSNTLGNSSAISASGYKMRHSKYGTYLLKFFSEITVIYSLNCAFY